MKRHFTLSVFLLFFGVLFFAGCGEIEDMIEEATERTVSIEKTILNSNNERDVKSVLVAESLEVQQGVTQPAGLVDRHHCRMMRRFTTFPPSSNISW